MINRNRIRYSKLALGLAIALAASSAYAQSTSSGLSGRISDASGQSVAGADVSIVHVESGTVTHATTDADGRYLARGLRVGGPYTITVTKDGKTQTREGVYLQLNEVASLDAKIGGDTTNVGTVVVMGGAISVFNPDNKGLGTSISGRQLETAVSGERSLDDIARLDPRIQVIDQNDGSISVAGQNNRYNNIKVDGLSQGDPFGLNANGLGYTGSPISPDVIAAYDLKVSDFDTASDTVGATINAVTKSGTNEFHGSLYYAFKNASSMVGNRNGKDYDGFDQNKTAGFTLGGPILKDKLFFFLSYEDQKITGLKGVGTDAVSTGKISAADVQSAIDIGSALGLQPGSYGNLDAALEDKRYVAKLDWNINENHRASLTYQRTEEARPTPYSGRVRDNSVVLTSNWYNIASETDNYALQLFSDWTDNFSTEVKASYQKYAFTAGAAVNQPEIFLNIPAHDGYSGGTIYMGEDEFRHENSIDSKMINVTVSGSYFLGDHVIKGGIDYLSNEVADLFGRDLHGVYTFDGLDKFALGQYSKFTKTIVPNGVTLNDIAGSWKYSQLSPYLQDTWQVNDKLSVVYGVRVNIPHADRAPPEQPVWEAAFGFPNNTTLDSGNKVVEPRVAFNYTFDADRQMQLRGGIGLFQTVPPYVWMTNPYLNNGVTSLVSYTDSSYNPADPFSPDPYNQPGAQSSDVTSGTCNSSFSCQIDAIDPNFKLPTAWKFTMAFDSELPFWGLVGSAEYQRIANKDAIAYLAPSIGTPNGTLPDGRYSYWKTLANSTTKIGTGTNYGQIPGIYYRSTLLTNTGKGGTDSLTLSLTKPMDHGFSGSFSATWTSGKEVNPGKSSQAFSNYNYVARKNVNELTADRSGYVVPFSVKLSLSWEHAFFGDYRSTASLFYNGRSGLPYSWIFGTDVNGDSIANEDLAYIPLVNDPKVSYGTATAEQIAAFQDFINSDRYLRSHRGQIAQRNKSDQPWVNQLDLGLQQELPGFFNGNKTVVRLDVYNLLNMLNNKWGQVDTLGFFGTRRLADVKGVANGQYVYDLGTPTSPKWQNFGVYDTYSNPSRVVSRWSALLTVRYEF